MEKEQDESVGEPVGQVYTTKCNHDWTKSGMNGNLTEYTCKKCWSGIQREDK